MLHEGHADRARGDRELQLGNDLQVQADADEASRWLQHCLDVGRHLTQCRLLQSGLHHSGAGLVVVHRQLSLQGPLLLSLYSDTLHFQTIRRCTVIEGTGQSDLQPTKQESRQTHTQADRQAHNGWTQRQIYTLEVAVNQLRAQMPAADYIQRVSLHFVLGFASLYFGAPCCAAMLPDCLQFRYASYRDDGGGDVLSSVDDLLDTWHTQGHVHAGYTSKVEGLEGHLGSWLTNTLCSKGAHSRPCTHTMCLLQAFSAFAYA